MSAAGAGWARSASQVTRWGLLCPRSSWLSTVSVCACVSPCPVCVWVDGAACLHRCGACLCGCVSAQVWCVSVWVCVHTRVCLCASVCADECAVGGPRLSVHACILCMGTSMWVSCVHARVSARTGLCVHVGVSVRLICIYVYTHVTCACVSVCVFVHVHRCVSLRVCVSVCVCALGTCACQLRLQQGCREGDFQRDREPGRACRLEGRGRWTPSPAWVKVQAPEPCQGAGATSKGDLEVGERQTGRGARGVCWGSLSPAAPSLPPASPPPSLLAMPSVLGALSPLLLRGGHFAPDWPAAHTWLQPSNSSSHCDGLREWLLPTLDSWDPLPQGRAHLL